MNNIEQMYKLAGAHIDERCVMLGKPCPSHKNCDVCDKNKITHPPFTAKKQIKMLEFLSLKYSNLQIKASLDDKYRIEISFYREGYEETLAAAIADFVNDKRLRFTEDERKEIKEILE